ncbi:hypothetical protein ACFPM0_14115 [Pseudonocardia sulfidoxydans]
MVACRPASPGLREIRELRHRVRADDSPTAGEPRRDVDVSGLLGAGR